MRSIQLLPNLSGPDSASARVGYRQQGVVLVVSLVFLLLMTIIGVAAMRTTILQERMAGNLSDSDSSFEAAEAALREGEQFLQQAALPKFDGTGGLLPQQTGAGQVSFWNSYDWAGDSRTVSSTISGVASQPQYVIEELPPVPISGSSVKFGPLPSVGFYRITARGVGGTPDAVTILQSIYRR